MQLSAFSQCKSWKIVEFMSSQLLRVCYGHADDDDGIFVTLFVTFNIKLEMLSMIIADAMGVIKSNIFEKLCFK